mgnify:CR=1 FL=1
MDLSLVIPRPNLSRFGTKRLGWVVQRLDYFNTGLSKNSQAAIFSLGKSLWLLYYTVYIFQLKKMLIRKLQHKSVSFRVGNKNRLKTGKGTPGTNQTTLKTTSKIFLKLLI